eukprot:CAMPEP_0168524194 /NCGR_PEP_ID=MMETSP0405-20121227/10490_1 /TAXON_ID=498012 /ORGANISM="Trichosphaerium sp, Strain Am-I-7 wt" /LENGTH=362 /DNA_ID=CAMNT_0008546325 /DNA_START=472 /DNA_END=1560 /DNA_ORIENTATION=-
MKVDQARLYLEGQEFWNALRKIAGNKAVSAFKMAMYPVILMPKFMAPNQFANGVTLLNVRFGIPGTISFLGKNFTVKKKDVVNMFNNMVKEGDPEVEFVIDYGETKYGYQRSGYMLKLKIKFSDVLKAANDNLDLLSGEPRDGGFDDGSGAIATQTKTVNLGTDTDIPVVDYESDGKFSANAQHYSFQEDGEADDLKGSKGVQMKTVSRKKKSRKEPQDSPSASEVDDDEDDEEDVLITGPRVKKPRKKVSKENAENEDKSGSLSETPASGSLEESESSSSEGGDGKKSVEDTMIEKIDASQPDVAVSSSEKENESPPQNYNEADVLKLSAMGFTDVQARNALVAMNGNLEAAANLLLNQAS